MFKRVLKVSLCDIRNCMAEYGVPGEPVTINTHRGTMLDGNGGVSVYVQRNSRLFFEPVFILYFVQNDENDVIYTEDFLDMLDYYIDEYGDPSLIVYWHPECGSENIVFFDDNGAVEPFRFDEKGYNAFFLDAEPSYNDVEFHARQRRNAVFGP